MRRPTPSRRLIAVTCLLLALIAVIVPVSAANKPVGLVREIGRIKGVRMAIHIYRPRGCRLPGFLFVFHGNSRSAANYVRYARPLADRACLIVFAPKFDEERFPNWKYHRGGIVNDGDLVPSEDWTVGMVADLVGWARAHEGRADAPYFLFGHSAGGQFLSRVAAFAPPPDATRIVIANPSSFVLPSLDEPAPYGFGGVFDDATAETMLRQYLQLPLTIYLGAEDTGDEERLDNEAALRQGENRLTRGVRVFESARFAAGRIGAQFAWKLLVVPGVGHSAKDMLASDLADQALGWGTH